MFLGLIYSSPVYICVVDLVKRTLFPVGLRKFAVTLVHSWQICKKKKSIVLSGFEPGVSLLDLPTTFHR